MGKRNHNSEDNANGHRDMESVDTNLNTKLDLHETDDEFSLEFPKVSWKDRHRRSERDAHKFRKRQGRKANWNEQ